MSETYQCKYQMNFDKDSNCTILNDPVFNEPVTFVAGQTSRLPASSQKIKSAIEQVDSEGVLKADTQWWAIYRVLTMPRFAFPTDKPAFCKAIENLQAQTTIACKYENWRKFDVHKLTPSPDQWNSIDNLGAAEEGQKAVGLRLLQLLED